MAPASQEVAALTSPTTTQEVAAQRVATSSNVLTNVIFFAIIYL
jgi:hypothetical protein